MHNWLGLMFLLILVFLLVNNASSTVQVLNSLGGQATALTATLQGRTATTGATGTTIGNTSLA